MTYVSDNIDGFDLHDALAKVSDQRRSHSMRYRKEADRRQSVAAYLLLCQGLRSEFGVDDMPIFSFGEAGKPFLSAYPDIHFNLSHCDRAVACVIDKVPVGIDVESVAELEEEVMRSVMNEDEVHAILSSENPALTFTRLWTMKESLLKLIGKGLSDDLPHVLSDTTPYTFDTTEYDGFVVNVCRYREL